MIEQGAVIVEFGVGGETCEPFADNFSCLVKVVELNQTTGKGGVVFGQFVLVEQAPVERGGLDVVTRHGVHGGVGEDGLAPQRNYLVEDGEVGLCRGQVAAIKSHHAVCEAGVAVERVDAYDSAVFVVSLGVTSHADEHAGAVLVGSDKLWCALHCDVERHQCHRVLLIIVIYHAEI